MARGQTTAGTTIALHRTIDLPMVGGWTMMAWCRVATATSGFASMFDLHRTGSSSSLGVYIDSTGGLGGCGIFLTSGDVWEHIPRISTWDDLTNYHHYAVTFKSPNNAGGPFLKFYFDGVEPSTSINSTVAVDAQYDDVAAYGCVSGGIASAPCFNQHFRLWSRPLAPNEILKEKRSRFPVTRQGLLSDLPLIYDNSDTCGSIWTESGGSLTTEVGPILGGWPDPQLVLAARSLAPRKWIFGAH